MEPKNIFIEPNEEIVSVVDRLVQNGEREISLVIPRGAQIWQSSINLKLLKREADILGKKITLVVSDNLEKEVAESAGFEVKKEGDLPVTFARTAKKEPQTVQAGRAEPLTAKKGLDKNKDNMIGLLVEEMESDKEREKINSSLENKDEDESVAQLAREKFPSGLDRFAPVKDKSLNLFSSGKPKKRMVDIVDPEKVKVNFFRRRILGEKSPLKDKIAQEKAAGPEIEPKSGENVISGVEPIKPGQKKKGIRWSRFFVVFVVLAVIIFGLVAYLVLPSAEITITPKTENKSFDLSLVGTVSVSRIDQVLNQLPLQEIKVVKSKSQEFLATGEKQLNRKAEGVITVYNEYSSSPQALVATTRFESPEGKIYRIPETVTVPGAKIEEGKIIASSIDVTVVADQPGEEYNIDPTDFTIPGFKGSPKFASFYGKSKEPISGGSTEKVKVVLADDLEQAKEILVEQIKGEMSQALEEQIPSDLKILDGGLKEEITEIASTAEENNQADKFTLEVNMSVRALLYREEDLRDLIDLNLIAQVPEDKRPLSETQKIKWQDPVIDWEKGEADLDIAIEEDLAFKIDVEKLKGDLAGKEEVEVRKYLTEQPEIEKTKVTFWPFWVKKIPIQEKKIEIIVD